MGARSKIEKLNRTSESEKDRSSGVRERLEKIEQETEKDKVKRDWRVRQVESDERHRERRPIIKKLEKEERRGKGERG